MPAKTKSGELIRAVSAFITEFYLLDLAGFSYIKPTSQFGQFVKNMVAFGLVNATVTPVMERRIADLLSKDVGLKFAVLDYLSVHPDDSNIEARFKNLLEGLALGALLEPLFIVFRIIKSTLTRTLITRIPTRRTYKLEAEKVEVDDGGSASMSSLGKIKIDYEPTGIYINQTSHISGGKNLCGPTTCTIIISDSKGNIVDLDVIVKQFGNVRPTGVNVYEINEVLMKNGISSESTITLTANQLRNLSVRGKPTIVGVKAGEGGHFIIVDSYKKVDGIGYYMIRDPYNGSMGVRADILESRLNHNGVILK